MQFNFIRLATALLLTGTFVGCAAVVKTPYEAPTVNIPSNFTYDTASSKNIHTALNQDQWWMLFNNAELNLLVEQVLAKNSDLAVAGIALQQARLQTGLAENRQGPRVSSSMSTGHNLDLNSGDDNSRGLSVSG